MLVIQYLHSQLSAAPLARPGLQAEHCVDVVSSGPKHLLEREAPMTRIECRVQGSPAGPVGNALQRFRLSRKEILQTFQTFNAYRNSALKAFGLARCQENHCDMTFLMS